MTGHWKFNLPSHVRSKSERNPHSIFPQEGHSEMVHNQSNGCLFQNSLQELEGKAIL